MKKFKIELESLYKRFENVVALKNVNLKIRHRERFGIFGPSGCGKTTLLRIISGFERPTSGRVYLDGKEVSSNNFFIPPEKRNVSFVFQDLALWPHMNVKEHLEFVLNNYNYSKNEKEKIIEKLLNVLELKGYEKRMPESLSGGEKQKLALARALAKKCDVLLLDEPMSSLDVSRKESVKKMLLKLHKKYKLTIIYVTHDIFELIDFCNRIAIMEEGKIIKIETPLEFFKTIKSYINPKSFNAK